MLKFMNHVCNTVVMNCVLLCFFLWALVGVVKAANILNDIKLTVFAKLIVVCVILIPIITYFVKF